MADEESKKEMSAPSEPEYPRPGAVSVSSAAPRGKGGMRSSRVEASAATAAANVASSYEPGSEAEYELNAAVAAPKPSTGDFNNSANITPMEPESFQPQAAECAPEPQKAAASNPGRQSRRVDAKTALREEMNALRSQGVPQGPGAVSVNGSVTAGTASVTSAGDAKALAASRNTKAAIKQEMEALRSNPEMQKPGAHSVASKASSGKGGATRGERPSRRARGSATDDANIKNSARSKDPPAATPGAVSETSKPSQKSAEILKAGGGALASNSSTSGKEKAEMEKNKAAAGAVSATGDEKSKILKGEDAAVASNGADLSSINKSEMAKNGHVAVGIIENNKSMQASSASLGKQTSGGMMAQPAEEDGLVSAQVIDEEELEAQYQAKMMKDVVAAEVVSEDEFKERGRCWKATCCCLFSIGIILAVAIPLSKKEEIPTDPPTPSPTEQDEYDYLVDLFYPYSGTALETNSTPQFMALEWLAFDDPMDLPVKEMNQTILLERYAAVVLYYALDGPNWNEDYNFLSNTTICDWHDYETNFGLFCEQTNSTMFRIEFSANGLRGQLPSEFVAFQDLKTLSLMTDPGLTGTLPSELGDMTSLTFLQLAENMLTGTIPNSYEKLFLDVANLEFNLLTGTVPQGLTKWDAMWAAAFSANMLEGPIPPLTRQSGMLFLFMYDNFFTGTIPTSYYGQAKLLNMLLNNNELTGTLPDQMRALTSMESFSVHDNKLSGSIPLGAADLDLLADFLIGGNNMTGTIPSSISRMRSLVSLDLSRNLFTGQLPSELGDLGSIESIDVSLNSLTGTVPMSYGQVSSLKVLDVSGNDIVGGLEAAFCEQPLVWTTISADCGGDNATNTPCSCCSTCCDENHECVVSLPDKCETKSAAFELAPDRGAVCNCVDGGARVSCEDTCESCNVDGSICVKSVDYGYGLDETTGEVTFFRSVLQYTAGLDGTLVLTKFANESGLLCHLEVNGEKCRDCGIDICTNGAKGYTIDCKNLNDGPATMTCGDKFSDIGYLEAFWLTDVSLLSGCAPVIEDFAP